jgi:hypothetical protein
MRQVQLSASPLLINNSINLFRKSAIIIAKPGNKPVLHRSQQASKSTQRRTHVLRASKDVANHESTVIDMEVRMCYFFILFSKLCLQILVIDAEVLPYEIHISFPYISSFIW